MRPPRILYLGLGLGLGLFFVALGFIGAFLMSGLFDG
jgi:hypothetical protein